MRARRADMGPLGSSKDEPRYVAAVRGYQESRRTSDDPAELPPRAPGEYAQPDDADAIAQGPYATDPCGNRRAQARDSPAQEGCGGRGSRAGGEDGSTAGRLPMLFERLRRL